MSCSILQQSASPILKKKDPFSLARAAAQDLEKRLPQVRAATYIHVHVLECCRHETVFYVRSTTVNVCMLFILHFKVVVTADFNGAISLVQT